MSRARGQLWMIGSRKSYGIKTLCQSTGGTTVHYDDTTILYLFICEGRKIEGNRGRLDGGLPALSSSLMLKHRSLPFPFSVR